MGGNNREKTARMLISSSTIQIGVLVAAPPSSVSLVPGRRQMQPGVEALQGYGCSSHTPRLLGVTSPGLAKEGKARAFSFFPKTGKNLRIS